jgi:hypothetical protein
MKPSSLLIAQRRCLETATVEPSSPEFCCCIKLKRGRIEWGSYSSFPLYNIEAHWEKMSGEEKLTVHEQLEALQVKDWKELSLVREEGRWVSSFLYLSNSCCLVRYTLPFHYGLTQTLLSTAYYVAFGPHGPRAPTSQPGDNIKIFFSTLALMAIGGAVFLLSRPRVRVSSFFSDGLWAI